MLKAYKDAMRRYFDFSGRSSRSQYWYFILTFFLVAIILDLLDTYTGLTALHETLIGIMMITHLIPFVALVIRRLHDFDKSGWVGLVFFVFGILFLIGIGCFASSTGTNRFGRRPGQKDEDRKFIETFT